MLHTESRFVSNYGGLHSLPIIRHLRLGDKLHEFVRRTGHCHDRYAQNTQGKFSQLGHDHPMVRNSLLLRGLIKKGVLRHKRT